MRRILRTASDDATIGQALEQLEADDRREAVDLEQGARVAAYDEYVSRRREREHEAVQGAYDEAKQAAIHAGPIDRDRLHMVSAEAADLERLRFEVREPLLPFEEWVVAGTPDVHQISVGGLVKS